jgi:hypothetical protein
VLCFGTTTVVIGDGCVRLQLLHLVERHRLRRILPVERAAPDAEERSRQSARTKLYGHRRSVGDAARKLVPARVEMPEKRRALIGAAIVTELQLRGVGAGLQPLQTAAHAGRKLSWIAEAKRFIGIGGSARCEHGAQPAVEIDQNHRTLGLALTRIGKDLARPHREPAVGELDLLDGHRARIGKAQQQRVTVGRIAGNADSVRHQIVRHRRHRAVEHLGEAEVRMQLVPDRVRNAPARKPVYENELLADVGASLQDLGLHTRKLGIAFEQRLQARRVLLPEALPECDRMLGRLELAIDGGLSLARVTSRKLGVQMRDQIAQHFGDRRTLARRKRRGRQRTQLALHRLAYERDVRERKRIRPFPGAVGVGKDERAKLLFTR